MPSFMLLIALSAVASDAPDRAAPAPADPPPATRPYHEISDNIHRLLRAEAAAEDRRQREAAIRKIAALYREIVEDPRLQTSDTLKRYKARLWSRLTSIKAELQRDLKRQAKNAGRGNSDEDLRAIRQATRSLADQISMMNYTMGGPSYVLEHGGGSFGGGTRYDHGQELVDLIQRTIKPDFWDVHGGPGTIYYYRPLMALVVRATAEVHGNVGGLLGAMRQAGP